MSQSELLHQFARVSVDPTTGASRTGYREIHGDVPSSGERVLLRCWAVVFDHEIQARAHYETIVALLGEVDGDARPIVRLAGVAFDRFGNLSEREGLIGERATIWVTTIVARLPAHGAILLGLDSELVQMLMLSPYPATGRERAPHVLEELAQSMSERQTGISLAPANNTMARLPVLGDLGDLLEHTSIGINEYTAMPR